MISHAKLRYLRSSPQKARLVVDQIRGKDVGDAMALLRASKKKVSRSVEKLVGSAVANAQQGEEPVDIDRLFVARVWVDQAPTERRGRPGPMGRFMPLVRRRSHITVELDLKGN